MIAAVRGRVVASVPGRVSLDIGSGVVLQLLVPVSAYAQLRLNRETELQTVLKIKDEDMVLYGFPQAREKALFEKLISVSGVGPKIAMSCISAIGAEEWIEAIAAADVARISSIPGIGKKTAQRLVLELTGKLGLDSEGADASLPLRSDLVSGLVNLGYPLRAAREAVGQVLKERPLEAGFEELFKLAMKKLKP